jgi:hypothetical protein
MRGDGCHYNYNQPTIQRAAFSDQIIPSTNSLNRTLSFEDRSLGLNEFSQHTPLTFGSSTTQYIGDHKQITSDSSIPLRPSSKTPKEKVKICFGTPLNRPDSKHSHCR